MFIVDQVYCRLTDYENKIQEAIRLYTETYDEKEQDSVSNVMINSPDHLYLNKSALDTKRSRVLPMLEEI